MQKGLEAENGKNNGLINTKLSVYLRNNIQQEAKIHLRKGIGADNEDTQLPDLPV